MVNLIMRAVEHDDQAPSIHVNTVSVKYENTIVLDQVSFRLFAGQRTAIVGPNGAGKTTLFKVIAGTLRPTQGRVSVFGEGPDGHYCIAYVPQRSQVDLSFPVKVSEVVMMGRIRKIGFFHWPKRRDWDFVNEALDRVGMLDLADRQIGQLSGGQQQRVFLARALAQEAEIVLLDEPLSGLDTPSQEAIFDVLDELREIKVTVLVATHDLNLAAKRFDQVALLNRQLVVIDTPDVVLTNSNLVKAYGGQMHIVSGIEEKILIADTCCDGDEHSHD
jgi:manganese/iron transport system ATP-binding protein